MVFAYFVARPSLAGEGRETLLSHGHGWARSAGVLGLLGVVDAFSLQIGLLMLGYLNVEDSAGEFRVAVQIAAIASMGLTTIRTLNAPLISVAFARGETSEAQRLVRKMSRIATLLALPFVALSFIAGELILTAIMGPNYAGATPVLQLLAVAALTNAFFAGGGLILISGGREWDLLLLNSGVQLLHFSLLFLVVPTFGAAGAAMGFLVAAALSTVGSTILGRVRFGIWTGPFGMTVTRA